MCATISKAVNSNAVMQPTWLDISWMTQKLGNPKTLQNNLTWACNLDSFIHFQLQAKTVTHINGVCNDDNGASIFSKDLMPSQKLDSSQAVALTHAQITSRDAIRAKMKTVFEKYHNLSPTEFQACADVVVQVQGDLLKYGNSLGAQNLPWMNIPYLEARIGANEAEEEEGMYMAKTYKITMGPRFEIDCGTGRDSAGRMQYVARLIVALNPDNTIKMVYAGLTPGKAYIFDKGALHEFP